MNYIKRSRLAAGLTQRELSIATGIFPIEVIADAECDVGVPLNENQRWLIQLVCNAKIKLFAGDAGSPELLTKEKSMNDTSKLLNEMTDSELHAINDELSKQIKEITGEEPLNVKELNKVKDAAWDDYAKAKWAADAAYDAARVATDEAYDAAAAEMSRSKDSLALQNPIRERFFSVKQEQGSELF